MTAIPGKWPRVLATILVLVAGTASAEPPPSGGDFTLKQSVIASGERAGGGDFQIEATAGQHDASDPVTDGDYLVEGGYWPIAATAVELPNLIFSDDFEL